MTRRPEGPGPPAPQGPPRSGGSAPPSRPDRPSGGGRPASPPRPPPEPSPDARPASTLAPTEFERCPVWEFDHTQKQEVWVRPVGGLSALPRDRYSLQVAASLTLADGTRLSGWADVSTAHGLELTYLMVFTDQGIVSLLLDEMPRDDRERLTTALGKPEAQVFPLTVVLALPMEGETHAPSRPVF